MKARYRLLYHAAAIRDLTDIHDLVASYAGELVADIKLAEIEATVYRWADYPKIGSLRDEIHPGLRAIPASDKAIVCFTVNDESSTVFILCFSYAGSDWASRVKDRS